MISRFTSLARLVKQADPMSREQRPTRAPTTEELRVLLGYDRPKLDLVPEFFGFVSSALFVGAILWTLGWPL